MGFQRLRRERNDPVCYAVQWKHGGPIKIGVSSRDSVSKRVSHLQVGAPYPLVLRRLMVGGDDHERLLHTYYGGFKIRAEWFEAEPELAGAMNALATNDTQASRSEWEDWQARCRHSEGEAKLARLHVEEAQREIMYWKTEADWWKAEADRLRCLVHGSAYSGTPAENIRR